MGETDPSLRSEDKNSLRFAEERDDIRVPIASLDFRHGLQSSLLHIDVGGRLFWNRHTSSRPAWSPICWALVPAHVAVALWDRWL